MRPTPLQDLLGIKISFSSGTGSMGQLLQRGDLMLCDKIPFNQLKVGDIISYRRDGAQRGVIHRVVKIDNDRVFTKGDANDFIDDPVTENEYNGVLRKKFRLPLISILVAKRIGDGNNDR
ncbi:MAG: signal peptidase I [Candidatus Thorarchaeota archaeon]|jgi:signal peptidase I